MLIRHQKKGVDGFRAKGTQEAIRRLGVAC